jgi:hypothetical protein
MISVPVIRDLSGLSQQKLDCIWLAQRRNANAKAPKARSKREEDEKSIKISCLLRVFLRDLSVFAFAFVFDHSDSRKDILKICHATMKSRMEAFEKLQRDTGFQPVLTTGESTNDVFRQNSQQKRTGWKPVSRVSR